jgi:uncharacterized BrkB/YihY/UPF0761 family membrane protein
LVTKWSKGAVLAMSLLFIFTFTLTSNVVFEPAIAWAESSDVSEEAQDEASGTSGSSGGFFSGIMNWINSVTGAINKMWGMENGNGVAMVVNGAFYLLLIVGALFAGKMIYNIISEALSGKVDEKYEKPSFRKK